MQVTAKSVFSDATVLCETQTRDIDTSHLNQVQRHYLKGVSENRQWEFTAGRLCAVQAIRGLGGSETEIPVGERGEPIWPKGFVGSITHTQGYAAAAVAVAATTSPVLLCFGSPGPTGVPELPLEAPSLFRRFLLELLIFTK